AEQGCKHVEPNLDRPFEQRGHHDHEGEGETGSPGPEDPLQPEGAKQQDGSRQVTHPEPDGQIAVPRISCEAKQGELDIVAENWLIGLEIDVRGPGGQLGYAPGTIEFVHAERAVDGVTGFDAQEKQCEQDQDGPSMVIEEPDNCVHRQSVLSQAHRPVLTKPRRESSWQGDGQLRTVTTFLLTAEP